VSIAGKDRYSTVAIILHWLIAFLIFWNIYIGLWMVDAIKSPDADYKAIAYKAFQFHKSLGLTVLALSLVRLAWRLTHKAPPLAEHMPTWEKFAAKVTHVLFYVIMIVMPLTGWLFVSAGWSFEYNIPFSVATVYFGNENLVVPHLPFFEGATPETRKAAAVTFGGVHEKLAYLTLALAALHIAAALKHHLFDRDDTLAHMLPFLRRKAAKPNSMEPI
jgi:cytochrome b561